jgi:CubicO group peptidase (beta-lactamase class C family)
VRRFILASLVFATVAITPAAPLIDDLDAYLRARTGHGTFSGVVLVARGDRVVFERAYGEANYETTTDNTPATLFRIASITKPLVATGILSLVTQGRMHLSDSVCRYLRRCPAGWDAVRIENLLAFSSGIPDIFESVAAVPPAQLRAAVDTTIQSLPTGKKALAFVPGSAFSYSNFDYLLLGYASEVASGKSWMAVLRDHVLKSAEMTQTQYDDPWAIIPARARGYLATGAGMQNTKYEDDGALSAGGLLSTAGDLYRFLRAFHEDRLIPETLVEQALQANAGGYGFGWQITQYFGLPVSDFSGGTNGFSGNISYYSADALSIVVLTNVENVGAKGIACDVGAIVHGGLPRDEALSFAPIDKMQALPVLGTYVAPDGTERRFEFSSGHLVYRRGTSTAILLSDGPSKFAMLDHPDTVFDFSTKDRVQASSCGRMLFSGSRAAH